jgi:hypothetical protein
MGQINLKSHNPNSDGLDLDCDEIIDQYSALSNPLTNMILALIKHDGTYTHHT